jgi:hypothetical protein
MRKLFFLFLSIFIMGCSKDDSSNNVPASETSNATAFFIATVGNETLKYIQDNSNKPAFVNGLSIGYKGLDFDKSFYYGSTMGPNTITEHAQLEITMLNMYKSTSTDDETTNFNKTFTSKPTNFITSSQYESLTKGISVMYTNAAGVVYSTLKGDQTTSLISYTSAVSGIGQNNMQQQLITGALNCKLYNENDPTDVLTLTNGTFKLYFREYDLIY